MIRIVRSSRLVRWAAIEAVQRAPAEVLARYAGNRRLCRVPPQVASRVTSDLRVAKLTGTPCRRTSHSRWPLPSR